MIRVSDETCSCAMTAEHVGEICPVHAMVMRSESDSTCAQAQLSISTVASAMASVHH